MTRSARFCAAITLGFVLGCAGSAGPDPDPTPEDGSAPPELAPQPSENRTGPPAPSRSESPPRGGTVTLQGGEWIVVEMDGRGLLDRSRISLAFEDGRLSGDASCNRYAAEWTPTAPGRIRIGSPRSTLRACAPTLMDQERRFLELLDRFESVTITPEEELVLRTADGVELRAARS